MLVYGDARRRAGTAALLEAAAAGGPDAFFAASELAQGLIDAEFEARGEDELTPTHRAAMDLLVALVTEATVARAAERLRALPLPDEVTVTTPEGYAFYAVYPQAYRMAARSVAWSSPPLVIGLRSIGTGLAAVVAAATDGTPLTLRPTGHPFAREIRASSALRTRLAAHPGPFAVVDEGPGLSGSSFGAVADLLEGLGVSPERIVFLPSHAGDLGPKASPRHRARWATARRAVATLDDILSADPIGGWFADLIGPVMRVEDLSGGSWRMSDSATPADPPRERRKFRLTTPSGRWIARFAGLGAIGEAKWARAQALHAAAFTPQPLALRRGFLLERWEDGAPLDLTGAERPRFLAHLARYIAFRARAFPATAEDGASAEALCEMALANAGLRLSPPIIGPRVHVDGRLHPWEWLKRPDGSFCKLDALDHSCAHDLIGCPPAAWDVAGAVVEFDLSAAETASLVEAVARAEGPAIDQPTLGFFETCYTAFQLGLWSLAEASAPNLARRELYARRLSSHTHRLC
jgi:hypothetical protein